MIARSELAGHRCGVATTRGDGVARPQQPVRPAAQEQRGASPRGRRTATAARWRRDRTRADPPGALHWTGARVWETRTTGCPVLTRVLTRRDTCEPARCTDTGCVSGRTRVDVSADRSLPGGRQSCSQTLELCTGERDGPSGAAVTCICRSYTPWREYNRCLFALCPGRRMDVPIPTPGATTARRTCLIAIAYPRIDAATPAARFTY
jgi:hypothetical protein